MRPTFAIALLLALSLPNPGVSCAHPSEPRQVEAKLEQKVSQYTLRAQDFLQALTKVASQFQIPMGIEWRRSPETLRNVYLSWRYATVREILEALVQTQPHYRLEVRNEVVHVFLKGSRHDGHDFLNLPIDKFEVQDEYASLASRSLHQRLNMVVSPPPTSHKPAGGGVLGSTLIGLGDRKVTVKLENVTARDVLDKLALGADFKIWVITYPQTLTLTRTGFWRVISIYNDHVADENQPAWDLLVWGFDPVTKTMQPGWGPVETNNQ